MPLWPPLHPTWPTNPGELPAPPAISPIPTSIDGLSDIELVEAAFILKLACGRSRIPLKDPRRAMLCVLAVIIDYEIYKRAHDHS